MAFVRSPGASVPTASNELGEVPRGDDPCAAMRPKQQQSGFVAGDEIVSIAKLCQRQKEIVVRVRRSNDSRKRADKHGEASYGVDEPTGLVSPNALWHQPRPAETI